MRVKRIMETEIDYKDEDNLELAWGYWYADEDYNKWVLEGKKPKNEGKQYELFGEENNAA